MLVANPNAVVGQPFEVTFEVTNVSSTTVEACFGEAFLVVFRTAREAQGWAETVSHPDCVQRFRLEPGEEAAHVYKAQVPVVSIGPARLEGGVQIVDPEECDKYGCDRGWVESSTHPEVVVAGSGA